MLVNEVQIIQENGLFKAMRPNGTLFAERKNRGKLLEFVNLKGRVLVTEFSEQAPKAPKKSSKSYMPSDIAKFSVIQRFAILEKTIKMVGKKVLPSAVIAGDPGMGKSFLVLKVLEEGCSLIPNEDFVVVKGYMTPKALYRKLWENKDKTLVFDDTDSILKDTIALNILKAALDSYSKRTISWLTEGFIPSELPASFDFTGQVIFISNLPSNKLDSALKTRSLMVDVSMELDEKVERMEDIITEISPGTSMKVKNEVLGFIKEKKGYATALSMRSLLKLVAVRQEFPTDWKDMALYFLANE